MKTLIRKELREHARLGALGLVVFALMLAYLAHSCTEMLTALGWQNSYVGNYYDKIQPLVSSGFLTWSGGFCAVFAAVLGFLQIFSERHRDLWAFLVHRPATRSTIFLSKSIAGLGLYLVVAGFPLSCFIVWVRVPGHVAAPFEWAMVLPCVVWLLAGIVFYFGGMLTGMRQARWYGSRALGLGLAVMVSAVTATDLPLWAVLLVIFLGGAVLFTAVWGSFNSHGHYHGQPPMGKLALIATLTPGVIVVALAAAGLLSALVWTNSYSWSYYSITRDGKVFKVTYGGQSRPQIVDLDGQPFLDPKTGRMIELEDFQRLNAATYYMDADFGDRPHPKGWAHDGADFFKVWRSTPDTLWYYWNRYGRLAGYDIKSRRFIGSLGPQGFTPGQAAAGDRFDPPTEFNPWIMSRVLKTPTTVCQVDLNERVVRTIFTSTNGETIGAAKDAMTGGFEGNRAEAVLVATRQFISLLTTEGKTIWKRPYLPAYPDYARIEVSVLQPAGQYALRFGPSWEANEKAGGDLPTHLTWLAQDQAEPKTALLPALPRPHGFDFQAKMMSLAAPPVGLILVQVSARHYPHTTPGPMPLAFVLLSLAAVALVCVPAVWWLGRRYCLSVPARLGWAVFVLLLGVPGFLAFLCVQEWPAREACPNCKKLRVVNRPQCEHCAAPLLPPKDRHRNL